VGLADARDRRVKTYSKGMRQRLGLAQALLGAPRLLLLDEPTVGLDPIATQDLYQLVDRLRQQGTSIILCSHVLPAILAHGRLQAVGSLARLREDAGLPALIRASGLKQSAQLLQRWHADGHQARSVGVDGVEVVAINGHKLGLLRQLLGEGGAQDIDIHQPSLEDLYRHYMDQARNTRTGEGAL
jgi:Cu-processing system ATP-binding protein